MGEEEGVEEVRAEVVVAWGDGVVESKVALEQAERAAMGWEAVDKAAREVCLADHNGQAREEEAKAAAGMWAEGWKEEVALLAA